MADTFTENYNLTKPEIGASTDTWGNKLNADLDAIDTEIKAGRNASNLDAGTVPNARLPGRLQNVASLITDLNTISASGFYRHAPGATGQPLNTYGILIHMEFDANSSIQLWYQTGVTAPKYIRGRSGTTWGAWESADYVKKSGDTMSGDLNALEITSNAGMLRSSAAANSHVMFTDAAGTERALVWSPGASSLNIRLGGGATPAWRFDADGHFYLNSGNTRLQANGNISGSAFGGLLTTWVDNVGLAHQNAAVNRSVTQSRMAGELSVAVNGPTGKWQNSGYVFTAVQGTSSSGDNATYWARQPQLYIANIGWFAAFPF